MLRRPKTLLTIAAALSAEGVRAQMDFEGGHWRRATPGGPATFVIPLAVDRNGFYHTNVRMGSNDQKFNFSLSASTGYTVVAGLVCSACGDQNPLYTAANSTSFRPLGASLDTTVDGVNQVFGALAKENCGLKQSNGSWWQYNNQTILVAASVNDGTRDVFTPQISGVIGLNPSARTRETGDTILGGWLARNPQAQFVSVGFALTRIEDALDGIADGLFNGTIGNSTTSDPNANSTTAQSLPANWTTAIAGEMHMLAPDPKSYVGDLVSVPVAAYEDTGGPTSGTGGGQQMQAAGWATKLEQWTFLNAAGEEVQGGQGAVAAVDPWYAGIVMPKGESENVFSKIPGSQLISDPTASQLEWNVPCNSRLNFTIVIGGVQFAIDPRDLIEQGETSGSGNGTAKRQNAMCPCSVQGWSDATVPGYMLGSSFMRNAYVVYNATQSGSDQQNSIGFANRFPFNTPTPAQAKRSRLTGIILGSVAAILITIGGAALGWLWWRNRQRAHRAPSEEFMDDNKGFAYGGFKLSGDGGFLSKARAGGVVIAPGVIFSTSSGVRRQGSDPESYPLMQTPPTTSSPPRAGQPLKSFAHQQEQHGPEVHVEDVDQVQELHAPAHQAYLARLAQHAQGRNVRWSSSTGGGGAGGGYSRISEEDDGGAHEYGDLSRVYEDQGQGQGQDEHEGAYDPPRPPAGGTITTGKKTWEQPYYPPAPSSGARISMVVEPITKPAEAAQKEEPSRDKES
ncbi:acid protease [Ceratobasidium sp. AG-I]|nr:acid protease [Ceratobasidium sp. AG-I]